MPSPQRIREPGVTGQLTQAPERYQLAQAVRLLLRWLAADGVTPEQAYGEVLRFQGSLSLAFPPGDIEAIELEEGQPGAVPAPVAVRVRVTVACIGLLGAHGALPFHYTERIAQAESDPAQAGARAFFDLLAQRMVALFCQAWGKHRLEHSLDTGGPDTQRALLLALGGSPVPPRQAAPDMAARYAGLLRARPASAVAISHMLAEYFGVPVWLEQFAGCWDPLPPSTRSTLGVTCPRLGYGAVLGTRMWRCDVQARIDVGQLTMAELQRFLPRGAAAAALAGMLTLSGAPRLRYEVRLLLGLPCIGPLVLNRRRRLGWDTFLPGRDGAVARPEVRYQLRF